MKLTDELYSGPYYEYKRFMEKQYGKALHKVPLDFNFSCPHRDNDTKGGCTFCSEDGSKATQIKGIDSVHEQIKASMAFAKQRYKAEGFTAYVQAYTATFAPLKVFKEKIEGVLDQFPFDSLHLGTRPDCLPASTLDYLKDLSQRVDLWVELGLQTCHNKTLNLIRRGHDWDCALKGLDKLKQKDLQVVTHAILGLPEETTEDMLKTAKEFGKLPFDGVKIHNLHILENTEMGREYKAKPYPLLGELEYIDIVSKFLQYIPHDLPIMRINTDTPPYELIAPNWTMQKGQLKKTLIDHMKIMGRSQGDLVEGSSKKVKLSPQLKIVSTMDQTKTCIHRGHGEAYHPQYGASTYSDKTFIKPIPETFWNKHLNNPINALDIGFGLGYNSYQLIETCQNKDISVHIQALEHHFSNTSSFAEQHTNEIWNAWHQEIIQKDKLEINEKFSLKLNWGDARLTSQQFSAEYFDLIYLDPFHEKNNAELITLDFISWLSHLIKPNGILICSRTHVSILNSFLKAGFHLGYTSDESQQIIASKDKSVLQKYYEIDLTLTPKKSKPYRDKNLCLPHREIVRSRDKKEKNA